MFLTFSGFFPGPQIVSSPAESLADLPHGMLRDSPSPTPAHLSHDIGAGPAVSTAVAHFYVIQVAGTLGEVSDFCEVPAGDQLLL